MRDVGAFTPLVVTGPFVRVAPVTAGEAHWFSNEF